MPKTYRNTDELWADLKSKENPFALAKGPQKNASRKVVDVCFEAGKTSPKEGVISLEDGIKAVQAEADKLSPKSERRKGMQKALDILRLVQEGSPEKSETH